MRFLIIRLWQLLFCRFCIAIPFHFFNKSSLAVRLHKNFKQPVNINMDVTKLDRHHAKAMKFYKALRNCKDEYIRHHINSALETLSDAIRMYGPLQLLSSYNGGKDADVIMHLLRAVVANYSSEQGAIYMPKLVYFAVEDEFDEVLHHIKRSESLFDLEVVTYNCSIAEVINMHTIFLLTIFKTELSGHRTALPIQPTTNNSRLCSRHQKRRSELWKSGDLFSVQHVDAGAVHAGQPHSALVQRCCYRQHLIA